MFCMCFRSLMLLYEPEAAAMAVVKHHMHPIPFAEGSTFMIVDAGGGTVDITTHEVQLLGSAPIRSCQETAWFLSVYHKAALSAAAEIHSSIACNVMLTDLF